MNILKKTFTILLILLANNSFAADSAFCRKGTTLTTTCANDLRVSTPSLPDDLDSIETLLWLESEVRLHQDIYRQKKDLFANLYRYIENGKLDDVEQEPDTLTELKGTISDFQTLYQMSKSIRTTELKLQICYQGNCSASRRSDLETQLASMQTSKTHMLVKRPLLSHSAFEEYLKKQKNNYVDEETGAPDNTVRELIKKASQETAQVLLEKVNLYESYLVDRKAPILRKNNKAYAGKYLSKIVSDFPKIVDDLLERFEIVPPREEKFPLLCSFVTTREKIKTRDATIKTGVEVSLFVAPIVLGGWGKAGAFGIESALGKRLLQWGLSAKEVKSGQWAVRAITALGTQTYQGSELSKAGKECKSMEQDYYLQASPAAYKKMAECRTEYNDNHFLYSLGWAAVLAAEFPAAPFIKYYNKNFTPQVSQLKIDAAYIPSHLKQLKLSKDQWAKEFLTADQGIFTYMDLSKLDRVVDPVLKDIPTKYWKFVGNIYSERLNLTQVQIDGFVQSSMDLANRTNLIINSSESLTKTTKFNGGVAVVFSSNTKELLPMEKSLHEVFPRPANNGKKVEIVRLTVAKAEKSSEKVEKISKAEALKLFNDTKRKPTESEKLSVALTKQAMALGLQDPDVMVFTVWTSRAHGRYYLNSQTGIKPISLVSRGTDVVFEFTREEAERFLKTQ